jgi:nicotinamide-nucleotide amidase
MMMDFTKLAQQLGEVLQQKQARLATAESCTGGWIAQAVTSVAGSSAWFDRGFVTYSNQAKQDMLGVAKNTLTRWGGVSQQTVLEMAKGALQHSQANVSIATSGIAGPDGGTADKPVGLVWFARGYGTQQLDSVQKIFTGDRQSIREQAVEFSFYYLFDILYLQK